jgi:predicted O-methyltransferase YrrM
MQSLIKTKDLLFIVALALIMSVISIVGRLFIGEKVIILLAVISFLVLSVIQISIYRRLQDQIQNQDHAGQRRQALEYKQIESLLSLLSLIKIKMPLPPMRDWAISPDFANLINSLIYEMRPKMVLETGSGVSTLIAAYSLKERDCGRIISLEHDDIYARKSARNVFLHDLQDVSKVVYCPLKEVGIHGKQWLWYDLSPIEDMKSVDLIIIDGPPCSIDKMARYPALPMLFDKLDDEAVILIDDASRKGEGEIIELWLKEFSCLTCEWIETEKGAVILRKNSKKNMRSEARCNG